MILFNRDPQQTTGARRQGDQKGGARLANKRSTDYKRFISRAIYTPDGMDFCGIPGEGFVPSYTRTTLTDHLHAPAGFRTDYQIITKQAIRRIISSTRKKEGKFKSSKITTTATPGLDIYKSNC